MYSVAPPMMRGLCWAGTPGRHFKYAATAVFNSTLTASPPALRCRHSRPADPALVGVSHGRLDHQVGCAGDGCCATAIQPAPPAPSRPGAGSAIDPPRPSSSRCRPPPPVRKGGKGEAEDAQQSAGGRAEKSARNRAISAPQDAPPGRPGRPSQQAGAARPDDPPDEARR